MSRIPRVTGTEYCVQVLPAIDCHCTPSTVTIRRSQQLSDSTLAQKLKFPFVKKPRNRTALFWLCVMTPLRSDEVPPCGCSASIAQAALLCDGVVHGPSVELLSKPCV